MVLWGELLEEMLLMVLCVTARWELELRRGLSTVIYMFDTAIASSWDTPGSFTSSFVPRLVPFKGA